jgi:hypothetical protein
MLGRGTEHRSIVPALPRAGHCRRFLVGISMLAEDPRGLSGADWSWAGVVPEMVKRLERAHEVPGRAGG